jgi:acetoin utilization deacetylase AcuC-like enzyme
MSLVPEDFEQMGSMIRGVGLPTIYVQEGGYKMDAIGAAAKAFFGCDD